MKSISDLPAAERPVGYGVVPDSPLVYGVVPRNPAVRVRVRSTVTVLSAKWVSVRLQLQSHADTGWLGLTHIDHPLLVARVFDLKDAVELSMEDYGKSALVRALTVNGAHAELAGMEYRAGDGVNEYRYWAHLSAGSSVALETHPDGTVAVIGLN